MTSSRSGACPSPRSATSARAVIGDSSEDKDYETMWHGAAGPAAASFGETIQTQYLDRYARSSASS